MIDLPTQPSRLYPRLLGDAWSILPSSIQRAHYTGGKLQGRFKITWGKSLLAKACAKLSRLPRACGNESVELKIVKQNAGERWERAFGNTLMATRQWSSADGFLIERFHGWDLTFLLHAQGDALVYSPKRAHLVFGPLRLRLPLALAPKVNATETGIDPLCIHVNVRVSLPLIGLLIEYDGHLNTPLPIP